MQVACQLTVLHLVAFRILASDLDICFQSGYLFALEHDLAFKIHGVSQAFSVLDRDFILLVQFQQVHVKGLHMILVSPVFNMFLNFVKAAFANASLNGSCSTHYLDYRQDVLAGFIFDMS